MVINNQSIVSPRLFLAELQLIYSVMDSGVDGWQGLTGKFEGKLFVTGLLRYVRSSAYDSLSYQWRHVMID